MMCGKRIHLRPISCLRPSSPVNKSLLVRLVAYVVDIGLLPLVASMDQHCTFLSCAAISLMFRFCCAVVFNVYLPLFNP